MAECSPTVMAGQQKVADVVYTVFMYTTDSRIGDWNADAATRTRAIQKSQAYGFPG